MPAIDDPTPLAAPRAWGRLPGCGGPRGAPTGSRATDASRTLGGGPAPRGSSPTGVSHAAGSGDALPGGAPPSPGPRRRPLLLQPIFGRIWAGSVASSTGSAAGFLALTWIVYVETGSAFDIALLGVAGLVPRATFGLFSGVLADRFDRLRLMILADGVRAGSLFALAAMLALFGFALWAVLAVVVVLGLGQSLFRPSVNSFLPTAVRKEELGAANGLLTAAQEVTSTLGSPLGGLLIAAVGAAATLALNGASYAISGLLILAVALAMSSRRPARRAPAPAPPPFLRQFREGFAYLRGQRGLLKLTLASFGANFFLNLVFTFLVLYVGELLHGGALLFGELGACGGAGFAAGSLLVGPLRPERRFGVWFSVGWGLAGLAIVGLVLFPVPLAAAVTLFAIGLGGGFGNTTFFTGVQKVVPNELLGRYLSLDEVGSLAAGPAGQIGGGLLIAAFGVGLDFAVAAAGTAVFALGLLIFRDVRALTAS